MPQYFCNSSSCGAAIQYTVVKPEKCPRCGKLLKAKAPLAVLAKIVSVPSAPPPPEEDDNEPLVVATRARVKPKSLAARAAIQEDQPVEGDEDATDDTVDDGDDPPLDKRAVRRLAREILANIDASGIHVFEDGDGNDPDRVRLGDLIRAKQGAQQ